MVAHPNLSGPLWVGPSGGPPVSLRLNLLVEQKAALVAYFKTLTDSTVTTAPNFQDPFEYGH